MLDTAYRLYVLENIKLARSLIIKSETSAEILNKAILESGMPVAEDPVTWKYYLNLTGQYHVVDTRIQIISSDDQKEITLTRDILSAHPLTKIEYGPGGKYHKALRAAHPRMKLFIDGVFSTNTMAATVSAPDNTIVYHDPTKVDDNETSLISELNKEIGDWFSRWDVKDYGTVDRLYRTSNWHMLCLKLVTSIANIRLSKCNTREVHSYHLWSKLSGSYALETFKDSLTKDQSLWLYRNYENIIMYSGKRQILDAMIDNLLTPNGLGVFKHDYVKDEENMLNTKQGTARFVKRDIADDGIYLGEDTESESPHNMVFETIDNAPYNRSEFDHDVKELTELPLTTPATSFPVGLLKVEQTSQTAADLIHNESWKMQHWIYLTSLDMFKGLYSFNFPELGAFNLTSKEALMLYIYAESSAAGQKLVTLPRLGAMNVVNQTYGSQANIEELVSAEHVTSDDIVEALADLIVPEEVNSYSEFEAFIEKVMARKLQHNIQYQKKTTDVTRAYLKNVTEGVYQNVMCQIYDDDMTYVDFLGTLKIADFGISFFEWEAVADEILRVMLEIEEGSSNLPERQRNVIEIVNSLSSYSLIVTSGKSAVGSKTIDWCWETTEISNVHVNQSIWATTSVPILNDNDGVEQSTTNSIEGYLPTFDIEVPNSSVITLVAETGLNAEISVHTNSEDLINIGSLSLSEVTVK